MGQITCSGNHHGIHEFPLQRIQKQFDTFCPATDSSYSSRASQKDGIGTESQHLQYIFAVADAAIVACATPATEPVLRAAPS